MGEVGQWDEGLFRAYRRARAESPTKRRLFNELLRINTPLLKRLLGQLRGDVADARSKGVRIGGRRRARVIGSEDLEWDVAFQCACIAWGKAMKTFDPARSSIATYLKRKIFHELQCAVQKSGVVTLERDAARPSVAYFEDDEHTDRFFHSSLREDTLLELIDANAPPPPPDARPVLEVLLADHCTFGSARRCAASALHGRHEVLAARRGELASRSTLTHALRERGVHTTSLRVAWCPEPVWAFAGVALQPCARAISAHPGAM